MGSKVLISANPAHAFNPDSLANGIPKVRRAADDNEPTHFTEIYEA